MNNTTLVDDFGRRTVFKGEELVREHTDTSDGRKPQWVEITVWRTEGGNYIVRTTTRYRVRHSHEACSRAEGYELRAADDVDTYPCPRCNKEDRPGGLGQAPRIDVNVRRTPQELIESFKQDGRYSNLARAVLAEISDVDEAVDATWNTVVVP